MPHLFQTLTYTILAEMFEQFLQWSEKHLSDLPFCTSLEDRFGYRQMHDGWWQSFAEATTTCRI